MVRLFNIEEIARLEAAYERERRENAILRTRIAGLEDDCNEYAELLSEEYDAWGKQFTLPYPDNPLTKERKEKNK